MKKVKFFEKINIFLTSSGFLSFLIGMVGFISWIFVFDIFSDSFKTQICYSLICLIFTYVAKILYKKKNTTFFKIILAFFAAQSAIILSYFICLLIDFVAYILWVIIYY